MREKEGLIVCKHRQNILLKGFIKRKLIIDMVNKSCWISSAKNKYRTKRSKEQVTSSWYMYFHGQLVVKNNQDLIKYSKDLSVMG